MNPAVCHCNLQCPRERLQKSVILAIFGALFPIKMMPQMPLRSSLLYFKLPFCPGRRLCLFKQILGRILLLFLIFYSVSYRRTLFCIVNDSEIRIKKGGGIKLNRILKSESCTLQPRYAWI